MINGSVQLTKKQLQILSILSDGLCHSFAEVMNKMGYDDAEQRTLITHISTTRASLQLHGQYIVTERMSNGSLGYRRVVLFTPAAEIEDIGSG